MINFLFEPSLMYWILLTRIPELPTIDRPGSKIILQFNFFEKL